MRFIVLINGVRQLRNTLVVKRGRFNVERRLRSGIHRNALPLIALRLSLVESPHTLRFTGMILRTLIHGHDTNVDRGRVSYPDKVRR